MNTRNKDTMTKPGHLFDAPLRLQQTEQTRQALSRAAQRNYTLAKLKPVALDWKPKART